MEQATDLSVSLDNVPTEVLQAALSARKDGQKAMVSGIPVPDFPPQCAAVREALDPKTPGQKTLSFHTYMRCEQVRMALVLMKERGLDTFSELIWKLVSGSFHAWVKAQRKKEAPAEAKEPPPHEAEEPSDPGMAEYMAGEGGI